MYLNRYLQSPQPSRTDERSLSPVNEPSRESSVPHGRSDDDTLAAGELRTNHEETDSQHANGNTNDTSLSRSSSIANPYELSQWKSSRKRALSEDAVAFAEHEARCLHLSPQNQEALAEYARVSSFILSLIYYLRSLLYSWM